MMEQFIKKIIDQSASYQSASYQAYLSFLKDIFTAKYIDT